VSAPARHRRLIAGMREEEARETLRATPDIGTDRVSTRKQR
jgi:hypothetical protein